MDFNRKVCNEYFSKRRFRIFFYEGFCKIYESYNKLFRFITPSFIIGPIIPLYVAWFFYMFRFYVMPYLMGYSVMGMLSFPLESEIAGEIYRLLGKNK